MIARFVGVVLTAAELILVLALLAMLGMVFGNVVLRYGFNSGITVSEEISRVLFVWVTFVGAVAVERQRGHLGFELALRWLPRRGRLVCRAISSVLVFICCVVFLQGAWTQTAMNMTNIAPVSGLPVGYAYAAAVVGAVGLGLFAVARLIEALLGHEPPEMDHEGEYEAEPGA